MKGAWTKRLMEEEMEAYERVMIVGREGSRKAVTWVEKMGVEGKEEEVRSDGVEEDQGGKAGEGGRYGTKGGGDKNQIVVVQRTNTVKRKGEEREEENGRQEGIREERRQKLWESIGGGGNSGPMIGNRRQIWAKGWRPS